MLANESIAQHNVKLQWSTLVLLCATLPLPNYFLQFFFFLLSQTLTPPSKVGMGRLDNGFANGFLGKGEKKSCKVRGDVKGGANVNQTN